ncbi:unnamed protein product, partial [Prorocentrum cordatum]
ALRLRRRRQRGQALHEQEDAQLHRRARGPGAARARGVPGLRLAVLEGQPEAHQRDRRGVRASAAE